MSEYALDVDIEFDGLDQLLLHLLSADTAPCAVLVGTDEDFQLQLIDRAKSHSAEVLLARKIHDSPSLASELAGMLRRVLSDSETADTVFAFTAARLSRALADSGVCAAFYKGPVLWRSLGLEYPSKVSGDLDLVVTSADMDGAHSVLSRLGYHRIKESMFECCYVSEVPPRVDLHRSLLTVGGWGNRLLPWIDQSLHRSIPVEIGPGYARTFAPTDMLFALLVHESCHHLCTNWASLHDIARCTIAWHERIDWAELVCTAKTLGIQAMLYHPLWLASVCLGAQVPEEAMLHLKPSWHRSGRAVVLRGFKGRVRTRSALRVHAGLLNLLSQPSPGATLAWLGERLSYGIAHLAKRRAI